MKCGFCYVADTAGYLDEAMHSIASLRVHMGDVPVAVVTPRTLFRSERFVTDWIELRQSRNGPIIKTNSCLAPYDRVIFLDTDTYVSGDLTDVFKVLDAFDIAVVHDVTRVRDYGRHGIPQAFYDYNTGFIAFRNNDAMRDFFDCWEEEYDLLLDQYGVKNDQPAFRVALWRTHQVRHATLSSEHNFIGCVAGSVEGTVRLVYDRSDSLQRLASTLNHELGPRAFAPGWGTIFGFRGRRDWIHQYLRLTKNFLRVLVNPSSVKQNEGPVKWWQEDID